MYLIAHMRSFVTALGAVMALSLLAPARAHVELDSPNGGETLIAGTVFPIEYNPEIAHGDTIRYQLYYSTVSKQGPWMPIDLDIPMVPSTNFDGTPHFYDWTVPNVETTTAYVRVFQDNPGSVLGVDDFEDISNGPFTIRSRILVGDYNGDGEVDAADYVVWRDTLGSTDLRANGDDTGASRGVIDAADYAVWKENFGNITPALRVSTAVPEPAAACWLTLAAWYGVRRRWRADL